MRNVAAGIGVSITGGSADGPRGPTKSLRRYGAQSTIRSSPGESYNGVAPLPSARITQSDRLPSLARLTVRAEKTM
jgi:hypothetical protein